MAERRPLTLGEMVFLTGDVTQNRWVGARSARNLEQSVGYGTGRLSAGWKILLLKQALSSDDFKFAGMTLRSGGREGLPAATAALDQKRRHVDDVIRQERGEAGHRDMQDRALRSIAATGEDRLVKIIPNTPHSTEMGSDRQYPMGGGGLQWTLIRPCRFLVAMSVDENGIATIASAPPRSVFLGGSAQYDDRAVVARFLNQA
jgi:hypothetical protein